MNSLIILLIVVIFLALLFDFLNGFHDAANAIATVVVTRTLTPLQAVTLAGVANFIGYFFFTHAIAKMVSSGIIHFDMVSEPSSKLLVLVAALFGAIVWNIITWIWGLPTSSSHAIIGGLIGAAIAAIGFDAIIFGHITIESGKLVTTGILPIVIFIVVAPLFGMIGAMIFTVITLNVFRKIPHMSANRVFRYLQLVSATWFSLGHGTNDAQKMMGIITLALLCSGVQDNLDVPNWAGLSCHAAIGIGTMLGGWRIVKTMGTGITKIRPTEGFCAESSAALVLMGTAHLGIPVSTTHVIAGSIMGVGTVEGARHVRWGTARRIVSAWFMTIPLTALCSAASYYVIAFFYY